MIAKASVCRIRRLEALLHPDRSCQGDQALQIEFRIEPQAERFRSLAVANRFGQRLVQTLRALLDPGLRKGCGIQRGAEQGYDLVPESLGSDLDLLGSMTAPEPFGQNQEMRRPNPQRPIANRGQEVGVVNA